MPETDTWERRQASSLFEGREGGNNSRIMELLSREQLTAYQMARVSGKSYSTIFDRLRALESMGIIKKVGDTEASKTHNKIPLWGLAAGGVYAAVFYSKNGALRRHALSICRRLLLRGWDIFSKLYQLPKSGDPLRAWIKSEQGIKSILTFFGHSFLDNNAQIVQAYRIMVDLGISQLHADTVKAFIMLAYYPNVSIVRGEEQTDVRNFAEAIRELASITSKHPRFTKLHDAIKQANAPLLDWLKQQEGMTSTH